MSTQPRLSLDRDLGLFSPQPESAHIDSGLARGAVVSPLGSVFPPPPTLDDIRRMEPDLSPQSMRRRASDCFGEVAKPAVRGKSIVEAPVHDERVGERHHVKATQSVDRHRSTSKAVIKIKMNAVSEFVVAFMLDMVQRGDLLVPRSTRSSSAQTGVVAMSRIASILTATTLPPAVPFLALWYVNRLAAQMKRQELPKDSHAWIFREMLYLGAPLAVDADELVTRLFVVGLMTADAWLCDHSFAVKTWRDVAGMPSKTLHTIQIKALYVLNYKLMPSDQEWKGHIRQMASLLCRLQDPSVPRVADVVDAVDDLLCEVMVTTPTPVESLISAPMVKESSAIAVSPILSKTSPAPPPSAEVKPLTIIKRPAPSVEVGKAVKRKLPPPAEWSPEQDPVVYKSRRTASVAIGAERAIKRMPLVSRNPWAGYMPSIHAPIEAIDKYPAAQISTDVPSRRGSIGGRASLDSNIPWARQLPLGFMQRQSH